MFADIIGPPQYNTGAVGISLKKRGWGQCNLRLGALGLETKDLGPNALPLTSFVTLNKDLTMFSLSFLICKIVIIGFALQDFCEDYIAKYCKGLRAGLDTL